MWLRVERPEGWRTGRRSDWKASGEVKEEGAHAHARTAEPTMVPKPTALRWNVPMKDVKSSGAEPPAAWAATAHNDQGRSTPRGWGGGGSCLAFGLKTPSSRAEASAAEGQKGGTPAVGSP